MLWEAVCKTSNNVAAESKQKEAHILSLEEDVEAEKGKTSSTGCSDKIQGQSNQSVRIRA